MKNQSSKKSAEEENIPGERLKKLVARGLVLRAISEDIDRRICPDFQIENIYPDGRQGDIFERGTAETGRLQNAALRTRAEAVRDILREIDEEIARIGNSSPPIDPEDEGGPGPQWP